MSMVGTDVRSLCPSCWWCLACAACALGWVSECKGELVGMRQGGKVFLGGVFGCDGCWNSKARCAYSRGRPRPPYRPTLRLTYRYLHMYLHNYCSSPFTVRCRRGAKVYSCLFAFYHFHRLCCICPLALLIACRSLAHVVEISV